jgi:hypothetical protein
MITSHAVFKGTFRLSIVAAVAAAAYTAYEGWQANVQAYNKTLQMVLTYECGGRQSDDTLRAALNCAHIDLSKVRCSNQPFFWASYNGMGAAMRMKLGVARHRPRSQAHAKQVPAPSASLTAIWLD